MAEARRTSEKGNRGVHSKLDGSSECGRAFKSVLPLWVKTAPKTFFPLQKTDQSPADMASKGEIRIDQARRGYDVAEDSQGQLMWYNPFYMKYAPDEEGNFNGQTGYGYISFEKFVDAVAALKAGKVTLDDLDKRGLPTLKNTIATTAILEAGRRSLDEGKSVEIVQDVDGGLNLR